MNLIKKSLYGRGNFGIPNMVQKSLPLSKNIGLVTEPIVAMKRTIKIKSGEKAYVDLIISANLSKEKAVENLTKYVGVQNVKRAFELSKARVEAENRYLEVKAKDIEVYQKMLSYIIFDNPMKKINLKKLPQKKYSQSDLWKYGISGDLPIILVKIKDANDIYIAKQILKAYEFFRSKNITVELVLLDEEKHSYNNYVREEIEANIANNQISYMKNIKGGIFILTKDEMNEKDIDLLKFVSTIIVDGRLGNLENELKDFEDEYIENYKKVWDEKILEAIEISNSNNTDILNDKESLNYYNEYGAFSSDGKEYLISLNKENRTPTVWSHIMANKKFGTIVTENMGGYTWYKNSRLNRITAWNNYACIDAPSEIIYLKDMNIGNTWSLRCKSNAR